MIGHYLHYTICLYGGDAASVISSFIPTALHATTLPIPEEAPPLTGCPTSMWENMNHLVTVNTGLVSITESGT